MSREIEFRAWLKKEYYSVLNPENKIYRVENLDFDKNEAYLSECGWYDFDDIELMQYTGKKDKNGTKIFEHDLIQLDGTSYIYEIVWDNESSSYKMQNKNDTFEWDVLELRTFKTPYITVLGNIYENKEML